MRLIIAALPRGDLPQIVRILRETGKETALEVTKRHALEIEVIKVDYPDCD